ncbi:MAG: flagellar export protein FliJ [candidate division FCPU426 bacterium]
MHQFHFGLETLLRIRRRQLEQAQEEFVRQQQAVIRCESELERQHADQAHLEEEVRASEGREVEVARARNYREYGRRLAARLLETQERLSAAKAELEKRRLQWMEAQQTVKTLEALRERRYTEYLKEARREEQNWLDEVALAFRKALPKH